MAEKLKLESEAHQEHLSKIKRSLQLKEGKKMKEEEGGKRK